MEPKYFNEKEKIYIFEVSHQTSHLHDHNFLELAYVVSGRAVHWQDGREHHISKGDYFVLDYNMQHQYRCRPGESIQLINCLFLPESIDRSLTGCRSFRELLKHHLIRFEYEALSDIPTTVIYKDDGAVYPLLRRILEEYQAKQPGYLELMRAYLIEILILSMRRLVQEHTYRLREDSCRFIMDYVEEHYMEPVTLQEIAQKLHVSLPHLSQKFKAASDMTFHEYLQRTRLKQACLLLANTKKKIPEISALSGYENTKFFNQLFKRYYHMSPREYRKQHQALE